MTTPIAAPLCPNCGHEGPTSGKGFCEVCGDFVDWGGIVEAARQDAIAAEAARMEAERADAARVQSERGPAARADIERAEADRARGADTQGPPAAPSEAGRPQAEDSRADAAAERRRARELLVPLADGVRPVLPGRPEPTRPDVAQVDPNDESGITCWNCGVGNRSDRQFCRNCGVDLSMAPTAPAATGPSWWSRFLEWLRRHRILVGIVGLVAVVAVLAAIFLPRLLNAGDSIRLPVQVAASSSVPAHPALDAFDQSTATFWRSAEGAPASLTIEFSRPIDVRATRITPAANGPSRVSLRFTDTQGQNRTISGQLGDRGVQEIPTPVDAADRVTVEFSGSSNAPASIAEVQFVPTG